MATEVTQTTLDLLVIKFSSRKFQAFLISVLGANLMLWFGKIDPAVYSTLVITSTAGYYAANVIQKYTDK